MYRVIDEVRCTRNQDGGAVLDIKHGKLVSLNVTGALIFEKLQTGLSEAQIVSDISEQFGISPATAQQDLTDFLESLKEQCLVSDTSKESML